MKSHEKPTEFERRFAPLRAKLVGYLSRRTPDTAEAEDVAQETLLAAYHQQDAFRNDAAPLPYLLGIARRRLRDRQRSRHQTEQLKDDAQNLPDATPQLIDSLTLKSALAKLSEAERRVLELTAIEGRTYKEAAAILREPVGTLKWRVHSAVKTLRTILSEETKTK
ncbi:RNA polymerase sigma factor [Armatimonas sp.]|uniref:RNA polymerase sigma factor n=1 Tax=Armatimonas sp. TaxID=1872638 RepID=UPI00286A5F32|nr:RNA polymerase sigma factor [Armatimonas sp.]